MINRNSWTSPAAAAILFVCTLGGAPQFLAQQAELVSLPVTQQSPPAASPTQPATPPTQAQPSEDTGSRKQDEQTQKTKENDRIFFALPNYLTVERASNLPPLTTKEKFKAVAEGCFDPLEGVFIGTEAGIGQADNTNPTYGQGFTGYSKRLGTDYADVIIGNFGAGAIFPTLLHQDPRYFQMGRGNFLRRFGYAAIRVIVTRSDRTGKAQFNFSELFGSSVAAGLSNTYHPGPHTIASNTDVLGTQVLLDGIGYELKEFWPDLRRLLVRAKHRP